MTNKEARQIIQDRLTKELVGPGSDIYISDSQSELISDYPLKRYSCGVLYPLKVMENNESSFVNQNKIETPDGEDVLYEDEQQDEQINKSHPSSAEVMERGETFFPASMGLSVIVPENEYQLTALFSFGIYSDAKSEDLKLPISESDFVTLTSESFGLPIRDRLNRDSQGYLSLASPIEGIRYRSSDSPGSGEWKAWYEFRTENRRLKTDKLSLIELIERLLVPRVWKRTDVQQQIQIILPQGDSKGKISLPDGHHSDLSVSWDAKVYQRGSGKMVRISLVNSSKELDHASFTPINQNCNMLSLFQSEIQLITNGYEFLPFVAEKGFTKDEESVRMNIQYRKNKRFSVGHNCATTLLSRDEISTTNLPTCDIATMSTEILNAESLPTIFEMSTFGNLADNDLLESLEKFSSGYESWIVQENKVTETLSESQQRTAAAILVEPQAIAKRLAGAISYLKNDRMALEIFRQTNSAMFIQFVISMDSRFAKTVRSSKDSMSGETALTSNLSLDFFETYLPLELDSFSALDAAWRPFQLAFLLLNIEPTLDRTSTLRSEQVDLLWFPTGGGKTEAYLGLTAFTILARRRRDTGNGTAVLMRYTLRLLTAQQFERASRLICALEFLRKNDGTEEFFPNGKTMNEPITLGLWVGGSSTPNDIKKAENTVHEIQSSESAELATQRNKFQIHSCPWCGTNLIEDGVNGLRSSFKASKSSFKIGCLNENCSFENEIPVQMVDEILYKKPPTLLFGTVDKFVQIARHADAFQLFGGDLENDRPELIIQDELHLLTGPLGSLTGLFEGVIEKMCTGGDGVSPRIVASTATTRNTKNQVKALYGNRTVSIFPPEGLNAGEGFFARKSEKTNRRYVGVMPVGKSGAEMQLRILATLLVARIELLSKTHSTVPENAVAVTDLFWTIIAYCRTLKDVGRLSNQVSEELYFMAGKMVERLAVLSGPIDPQWSNLLKGISGRYRELTSRIESSRVKKSLEELGEKLTLQDYNRPSNSVIDLAIATNMIAVGLDVSRLNLMLLCGIPSNMAEYIQASSRIARSTEGLAITLCNPNRARERSLFEDFNSLHEAFYRFVEPVSITPITVATAESFAATLLTAWLRGTNHVKYANNPKKPDFIEIKPLIEFIEQRFPELARDQMDSMVAAIKKQHEGWVKLVGNNQNIKWSELFDDKGAQFGPVMNSLRETDNDSFLLIKHI